MVKKNDDVEVEEKTEDETPTSLSGSGQKWILVKANVSCFGLQVGETGPVADDFETQLAITNGYLTPVDNG